MEARYLTSFIKKELPERMVFLGGARQAGKTTLSLSLLTTPKTHYLNWDIPQHREKILKQELPAKGLIVFDEIHKYKKWRAYMKGLFDLNKIEDLHSFLVTGSAKLDFYRHGGDSLQGRYSYYRLHPLSFHEIHGVNQKDLETLYKLGPFPEPFFKGSSTFSKKWSLDYRTRLIREDIVSLETLNDLGLIELLMLRLPECVGAPLSINSIREDLQVAHKSVDRWISVFERFFATFRISPFGHSKIKSVKKESKLYFLDWTQVPLPSAKFENLIASHLLKWVDFKRDTEGEEYELRFFKDLEQREIDFVITKGKTPCFAIECKWDDAPISPVLNTFKKKFPNCEVTQVSYLGQKDYLGPSGIRVMPAFKFLKNWI